MFYDRKAIQKRIILERYKDEDVDPTWYSGDYGDDVQAAENAYYRNHGLHYSQYAPDHGPSDLRASDIDSIEDHNGQYTNEKGERRGGAYGSAKLAQAKWVEWCSEHYPDKKWEDVAADVVTAYYTELKKKYEKAQARENQLKDRIRTEKGEGRVREIETHDGSWSDIRYGRKEGINFEYQIAQCDKILAKPKHYVLRSEGLRALGNIEDINVDDLYGDFERQHDQFNQAEKDKWVGWYAMFTYFADPALELLTQTYKMNPAFLKELVSMDWKNFGMSDEEKANRTALRAEYDKWKKDNTIGYLFGLRAPSKFDSVRTPNKSGIGTAARKELLKRLPEEWRDSIRSARGFSEAWADFIRKYANNSLREGKYANPKLMQVYNIFTNLYKLGELYNNKLIYEPDDELKELKPKGDNAFSKLNMELEKIWKNGVKKASMEWDRRHPEDSKNVQHSNISGAW